MAASAISVATRQTARRLGAAARVRSPVVMLPWFINARSPALARRSAVTPA
jgi:hypothetical protein